MKDLDMLVNAKIGEDFLIEFVDKHKRVISFTGTVDNIKL